MRTRMLVALFVMGFCAAPAAQRKPDAGTQPSRGGTQRGAAQTPRGGAQPATPGQPSPGAGPIVVLETEKGVIEFETYPEEAPKTVAQIIGLVKRNFYNGQRFHRAEMGLIQIGDPQSKNPLMKDWWGRSDSGKPVGVAEITKKRRHVRGAVGLAYAGNDPRGGTSQFYITMRDHPQLDAKYAVFGKVIKGMEVVDHIRVGDQVRRAYVRENPASPPKL